MVDPTVNAAAGSMAAMSVKDDKSSEPKSFAKRDHMLDIQKRMQAKWDSEKVFEVDAKPGVPKFLGCFPYPYMNGRLHLGHAFTATKTDFATRYHRLKGENVLYGFGFHCTGMPIQAAANKLRREIEAYGNPPNFPTEEVAQSKPGQKSKVAAKTGGTKYQWDILKMMVPEEEIPKFVDPYYWVEYFPEFGRADLKQFGFHVDWRRSFVTTDINPYYDAFIRWQFRLLNERGRIRFGKRPNIYSTIDKQVCADHDRAHGEAVGPQEYTLIKMKVLELPTALKTLEGKQVFLVAATLRPETMYGQTNCFVLPEGEYGAFEMKTGEIFICTERSAKNMAHQDLTSEFGVVSCLLTVTGRELIGTPLKAPLTSYERVYTLPLLTISMKKGTGVVTSVPSDAPDDYAALMDLKNKPALREKFGVTEEMVAPFEVIPIINIPGISDRSAVTLCEQMKIKSQNDTEKLKEAKEKVYLKGFYDGVMLVGDAKGKKVCDAKPLVRAALIESNEAVGYYEPESLVVSRSGDECVVALTEQWYITYGEEDWKKRVLEHIHSDNFRVMQDSALSQFDSVLGWLHEWACSRLFGLGTRLPWDEKWVIESLSDSTIYMAYYPIAHLLQGDFKGSTPGILGIKPEQMTDEVWNYIYLQGPMPPSTEISKDDLDRLRGEFEYWYPYDLRASGKDLIPNHLTMSLYNHAEVWRDRPEMWPRCFYTNGHVMVDAEKMAKSRGNFLMMQESSDLWGADATRYALADGGDSMDDANFARQTANSAILRLTAEEEWILQVLQEQREGKLRSGELNLCDRIFHNDMHVVIAEAEKAYENMQFRECLKWGFFELQLARDSYRDICERMGMAMHADLINRFAEVQAMLLWPICPHFCEELYSHLKKEEFAACWPASEAVDAELHAIGDYLRTTLKSFRESVVKQRQPKKGGKKGKDATPAPAPESLTLGKVQIAKEFCLWKQMLLNVLRDNFKNSKDESGKFIFAEDIMRKVKDAVQANAEAKKNTKKAMQFAAYAKSQAEERGLKALDLSMKFDEREILTIYKVYLKSHLDLTEIEFEILDSSETATSSGAANVAEPGKPVIRLFAPSS